ncbi:MAG: ATP-binding protein [Gammaproteobacteria bacterium]|jgi:predicted AAA+ superfamily ATPase
MKRQITNKLIAWKNSKYRKPLIIQGFRQIGKTFELYRFGANHFPNTHYLNFEQNPNLATIFQPDLNPKRILSDLALAIGETINADHDLLIFDEIQACPKALTSLKYFNEEMPELALCAAGSLLCIHLSPASFPVGKVNILKMHPMSFVEFLMAIDDQKSIQILEQAVKTKRIPEIAHTHLWKQMKLYFIVGGLPEAIKTFNEHKNTIFEALNLVRQKQQELMLTYYADIAKHSGKVNAMQIERIWKSIPAQLAHDHNSSARKFKFKGILPNIDRYSQIANAIDWLIKTELIIKSYIVNYGQLPFNAYTKESSFKLFISDVGLLGALNNLQPKTILDYDYGTYKGYFAENFVAQELICAGTNDLYTWQENRAEIEFLKQIDGSVVPIEVKAGNITKSQSINKFITKYNSTKNVILSGQNLHIDKDNKIQKLPLYLASKIDDLIQ